MRMETGQKGRIQTRKENIIYVGIDLHKETHKAVMLDCWNQKLGENMNSSVWHIPVINSSLAISVAGRRFISGSDIRRRNISKGRPQRNWRQNNQS